MSESGPPSPGLHNADENIRLQAARELGRNPSPDVLEELRIALANENVRWVRAALERAIERCQAASEGRPEGSEVGDDVETDDLRQTYADGRRDGLRQALHELTPLLGLARAAALDEEADPGEVQNQLNRMRTVAAALRRLVTASSVPQLRDFDLAPILRGFESSPPIVCPEGIVGTRGKRPFVVRGDPDLLGLAVQPLVTNAIEAVLKAKAQPTPRSVIISWGAEQEMHWVAVIDAGVGPPGDIEDPFALGATDKDGHPGLGLETARTAIVSLGGHAELNRNQQGGATVILRWPRP